MHSSPDVYSAPEREQCSRARRGHGTSRDRWGRHDRERARGAAGASGPRGDRGLPPRQPSKGCTRDHRGLARRGRRAGAARRRQGRRRPLQLREPHQLPALVARLAAPRRVGAHHRDRHGRGARHLVQPLRLRPGRPRHLRGRSARGDLGEGPRPRGDVAGRQVGPRRRPCARPRSAPRILRSRHHLDGRAGERVVPRILDHETISLLGDLDAPHSWSYVDDVVRALADRRTRRARLGSRVARADVRPRSPREAVDALAQAAGLATPPIRGSPGRRCERPASSCPRFESSTRSPTSSTRRSSSTRGRSPRRSASARRPSIGRCGATVAWWRRCRGFPLPSLADASSSR